MADSPTQFFLQEVATRIGLVALVTMDNGEDWQKPNVFGRAAIESLNDVHPRLNPSGGAIACGHPLAATGVRLMAQLAFELERRPDVRYGLTALCIGLGMGAAILWENTRHG